MQLKMMIQLMTSALTAQPQSTSLLLPLSLASSAPLAAAQAALALLLLLIAFFALLASILPIQVMYVWSVPSQSTSQTMPPCLAASAPSTTPQVVLALWRVLAAWPALLLSMHLQQLAIAHPSGRCQPEPTEAHVT